MCVNLSGEFARSVPQRQGSVRRAFASRDPWRRLHAALNALGQGQGEILSHRQRPWASITFAGTRHAVALVFRGAEAVAAGETFIAALPEHEFSIPGQLVADAVIKAVDHVLLPQRQLTVELELLLLEES